jgi:hypothetical protein
MRNAATPRGGAASKRRAAKGARELEAASRRARNPKRNAPTPHGTTYKFYPITLNDYGYYIVPKIDKDTWFDTIPEAKKHIDWWEKRKRNKGKRNPAAEASEAYTDFHGRPSEEVVTMQTTKQTYGRVRKSARRLRAKVGGG